MNGKLIPPRIFFYLAGLGLILLVAIAVVLGIGAILRAMGDACGACALGWVALACSIPLAIDLLGLLFALAWNAAAEEPFPPEE